VKELSNYWKNYIKPLFSTSLYKEILNSATSIILWFLRPLHIIFITLILFAVNNTTPYLSSFWSKIPNKTSGGLEISLEIATSISIVIAMVIFAFTIITENARDKKARRNEFKLRKIEEIHSETMSFKKNLIKANQSFISDIENGRNPFGQYESLISDIGHYKTAIDEMINEKKILENNENFHEDISDLEDNICEYKAVLKEYEDELEVLIKESSHDLCEYSRSLMVRKYYINKKSIFNEINIYKSYRTIITELNEYEKYLLFNPMIAWSLNKSALKDINKLIANIDESYRELTVFNRDKTSANKLDELMNEFNLSKAVEFSLSWYYDYLHVCTFDKHYKLMELITSIEEIIFNSINEVLD